MKKRTIRLPNDLDARVQEASRRLGFQSTSDFIRDALKDALQDSQGLVVVEEAEQRMVAGLDRVAKEVRSVRRTQQAQFAQMDTLVKVLLTCVPEPGSEVYTQAKARGMVRYAEFLKSVGKAMVEDSKGTLAELLNSHVPEQAS